MIKVATLLKNKLVLLLFIVLLAAFFRFWQLSNYPVSLTIDEAAVGYNAYSILKTGRDEHGEFLPLSFLSIGDYKPPLHIYLAVPTVAIFGLNEFGVRFSMALISSLTVISTFLLIRQLTKNKDVALLSSFLLAISPWHIHFARFSQEGSLAIFLTTTAVWLFLRSLENKGQFLWFSAVLFVLSMYAYHTQRIFIPLLIIGLGIIFWKQLLKYKIALIKAFIIGVILLIPLTQILLSTAGQTRANMVFITKEPSIQTELKKDKTNQNFIKKVFDNDFAIVANLWTKKYLNYFDPKFLFFSGLDLTQTGRPDIGVLYLFEFPLFLYGVWLFFIKRKFSNQTLVLYWLLIGPLVASLTIEEQHILRSSVVLPIPSLLVALGIWGIWQRLKERALLKAGTIVLGSLILVVSIGYYLNLYYVHSPIQFSEFWQYGWKDAALYAWQNKDRYREIVVDPTFGSESPNIVGTPPAYFLFYGKYDPTLYQKSPRRTSQLSTNFENFTFRPIYWPADRGRAKTLFIGSPWVLPKKDLDESQIKKIIKFKNGTDGILTVESKGNDVFPLE